uniref:Uncharacterized protein n=1 Tax=Oryza meridionalis TaxID=40149 RepID=A0A0E0CCY1_9ORYZ
MSTSEEAGLPDPTTAASSLVDCRLPGREGCKPLHPSSPLSSHLHADPVVALFGSTTLLSTVFLARSPRRSPSLGARSSSGAAGFGTRRTHADWFLGGWGEQEQQLGDQSHDGGKAWAMAKYGDDGVQMGNEQCCQQEIEDTKHGLESGSITYDPAKLKFSDDIKDSRQRWHFIFYTLQFHISTPLHRRTSTIFFDATAGCPRASLPTTFVRDLRRRN